MSAFGLTALAGVDPPTPPIGPGTSPSPILTATQGINDVINAWYAPKIALANAKAAQKVAEAQGRYAVTSATVGGLPSANILLLGGGALLAVLILSRGGGGRRR